MLPSIIIPTYITASHQAALIVHVSVKGLLGLGYELTIPTSLPLYLILACHGIEVGIVSS